MNSLDTCQVVISDQLSFSSNLIQFKTIKDSASFILPTGKKYFWKVIKNSSLTSSIDTFKLINPQTLDSLVLWVNIDTITAPIGTSMQKWTDLSPKNNHLIQNVLLNQPKVTSGNNYINNSKVINFDGFDDYLQVSIASLNQPLNYFLLLRNNNFSSTDIFDGANPYSNLLRMNSGFYGFFAGSGYVNSTSPNNDLKFKLLNIEANTSASKFYSNGILNDIANPGSGNPGGFTIGGNAAISNFTNVDVSEIIIIKKTLTDSLRHVISNYIMDKNSPPVSLGANIVSSNNFCDTLLNAGNGHLSYVWSTNETSSSIRVNQSGTYWVRATDIFGRLSSDTIRVLFNRPSVTILNDTFLCKNSSILWNTHLPKSNYTFLWQDNSVDSILSINQAGDFYVKIIDQFGCSITSDTVEITEDNFSEIASLGPDTSLCAGNSITLTNGASPTLTYTWSNGSNNDSLLINTSGQYSVVVTNTNNCVARDTINVMISGQAPIPSFTTSIGCISSAMSFTNLSTAPSSTITTSNWDFGDPLSASSNSSTVSNPFHTFSDTGTYTVRLNVITSAGCEQAITKTIHIAPNPTVNFSIGNSCQNDSTAFSNLSTSATGYSITSLNWNFGDPGSGTSNTSSASNPKHVFGSQTNYTISLTATNNAGCSNTLTNIITVKAQVKADFTYSTPCTNTATVFQDNSIAPSSASSTRFWNFGTSTSPGLTVPKTYTATGPYNVSLTVNVNGCISSISKIITIFSPPLVSFTIPAFCSKDTVTAINSSVAQSGVISSYNWRLNNNSFSSVQNPTLSLSTAGNYPVRLTVINSFGCKDSLSKTITVNPLPIVDFTTNPANYYYVNEQIGFIPSITNAASYYWNVSGIMTSTIQSPSASINSEGSYTVSLNLEDQQGCKNSKTKTIVVSKRYLDLAILNVTTIKDDDGFMTVVADIANYGTVPATTINLQYQISDGGNNKETWNGILNPNSLFTYTFNSKSASQANSTNNITCVAIKKVNSIDDGNQNNNDLCSALYYDEISVSNPFPNPTAENLTLPIILNKDIDYSMSIYSSTGQMLQEETTQKGLLGLNLVSIPTSSYAWGCYILKVVIDDKIFIKKFIKVNN